MLGLFIFLWYDFHNCVSTKCCRILLKIGNIIRVFMKFLEMILLNKEFKTTKQVITNYEQRNV